MIAYNNKWLHSLYARDQADDALDNGCINTRIHEQIYSNNPTGFYTPNIWGRIGIALLTVLTISFSMGFFGLIFSLFDSPAASLIMGGLITYAALELLIIRRMNHYNSGSDNVLIAIAAVCLIYGINTGISAGREEHFILLSLCPVIICTWLAIRFADSLMSIAAVISCMAFLLFVCIELGDVAKAFAPFVLMGGSVATCVITGKAATQHRWVLYRYCLQCACITSLILLYLSGNYFLVKESANELFHKHQGIHEPITLGWFFWLWTIALPFVYIGLGIRNKSAILIRTGLVLVGVIIFTYRYYYSVLSPDKAMCLGGIILILISYSLIRYLHIPKHGFTFDREARRSERGDIHEALAEHVINKGAGKERDNSDWS